MARVMPSQVVQMIDDLYPHAAKNTPGVLLSAGDGRKLLGILNLLKEVPDELIALGGADFSELILAKSTIEDTLEHWRSSGAVGNIDSVKRFDVVTVIRRAVA
jgi:hypothetical protein